MYLPEFYELARTSGKQYTMLEIAADEELTTDIQKVLIWLKLLDPPVDGKFGPITTEAFKEFQGYTNCSNVGILDFETSKKLIETDPKELEEFIVSKLRPGNDLAGRIIKYMLTKDYSISVKPGEFNIVYVEGMNADGTENTDTPNHFNDRRMVIEIVNGTPKIVGNWEATTEPGRFWTVNPMNPNGAARIKFGQYKAWQVGAHITRHTNQGKALVQTKPVTVHRDFNKDGFRTGDKLDTGLFGINQHHANGAVRHDIGRWAAGCFVGRTAEGHEDFMDIIMKDRRYKLNANYTYETTIIAGDDLVKNFPVI
ncbi:peptidoglycan-binding domain-containing protein [Oscillatoria sp. FACHB-1406]|uniref:peptidoglycan-binding domain-containing protein n=1 Tax=Oscillatoria sp. FACHB-1406 TaxID=2692846 RepID=UPI001686FF9B|nr:peptidoglycan-binding domain-containing protein [Oscillatoria sp. FACHB-1406]MBD2579787.1 peptidoglycan-binding protein [Oscillatoria sp. FACHB-1406]